MTNEQAALEKLIADATSVLRDTERNLQQLAQQALSDRQLASENGDSGRLTQIGQQLSSLSQRSRALHQYLQNQDHTPPANDEFWPRIRILQSHEEERTQLARNLEDSVGQLLANAVFELASCKHLLDSDRDAVAEGLDALQQELEQGLADVRHFIMNLEPTTIIGNFGLAEGVRRYLERFESRTGIKSKLWVHTNMGRLPSVIEITIFRVIQEALQNVQLHAGANLVEVSFSEQDDQLVFSVLDDGSGVASDRIDASRKNLGLARMVDYAELLQGQLKIFSEPGQGTRVVLRVPHQAV